MLHNPLSATLFPKLPQVLIDQLMEWGDVMELRDGATAFTQNESEYGFYVILEGGLKVSRRVGADDLTLTIHRAGEFAGDMGLMSLDKSNATGVAVGRTRLLRIAPARFRQLLSTSEALGPTVMATLNARTHDVEAQLRQQEKMAALGKLSAGLAHELNNPAAAAVRSAKDLNDTLKVFGKLALAHDSRFSDEQREAIHQFLLDIMEGRKAGHVLGALERSDREATVCDWLEAAGIGDAWDTTAMLVDAGVTEERLTAFAAPFNQQAQDALSWIQAAIRMSDLTTNIEQSTQRISELVLAMKRYSHVDQASLQVFDIHQSLETTLTIFGHRLRQGIHVERNYDTHIPSICAYAGELNQVWTNIIDNAIDAMQGKGTLGIRTALEDNAILVELSDTGPGIPDDVQPRIFEPFFTTKPIGKGTGLGLDISYRIVNGRHRGTLTVQSKPGDTRFQIRLPLGDVVRTPEGGACPPMPPAKT